MSDGDASRGFWLAEPEKTRPLSVWASKHYGMYLRLVEVEEVYDNDDGRNRVLKFDRMERASGVINLSTVRRGKQ